MYAFSSALSSRCFITRCVWKKRCVRGREEGEGVREGGRGGGRQGENREGKREGDE